MSSGGFPIATRRSATAPAAAAADSVARDAAIEIARSLADTKCANVRLLDVRGISPVCDFLVLGTGTSARQMKSAADDAVEVAEQHGLSGLGRAGTGENWIAVDLVDVVIHLFSQEGRMYYDLDNLWGDAEDVSWKR